jgi:hypothetical protein
MIHGQDEGVEVEDGPPLRQVPEAAAEVECGPPLRQAPEAESHDLPLYQAPEAARIIIVPLRESIIGLFSVSHIFQCMACMPCMAPLSCLALCLEGPFTTLSVIRP